MSLYRFCTIVPDATYAGDITYCVAFSSGLLCLFPLTAFIVWLIALPSSLIDPFVFIPVFTIVWIILLSIVICGFLIVWAWVITTRDKIRNIVKTELNKN